MAAKYKSGYSRYFLFTRVNPRLSDYECLINGCKSIHAFYGWKETSTYNDDGSVASSLLRGFLILENDPATCFSLSHTFPNFLIVTAPKYMDFDLASLPTDVNVGPGSHPFASLKRRLFDVESINDFFSFEK